ncbi:MAG: hypothetical protein ABJH78_08560 [Lentilitoribacter sp.]
MEILYHGEDFCVEYYKSNSDTLVYTFNSLGYRDYTNPSFAQKFVTDNGMDLIAFKTIKDNWFQNVTRDALETVSTFALSKGYEKIITYGASMGGYASIVFSKMLMADIVIAVAPQYAIDQNYDRRWANKAKNFKWIHDIEAYRPYNASFYILYDNHFKPDVEHVFRFQKLLNKGNVELIKCPHSEHHPAQYLEEIGVLRELILSIINQNSSWTQLDLFSGRRKSKRYFISVAKKLSKRGKLHLASSILDCALSLDSDYSDSLHQKSLILWKLNFLAEAIRLTKKAIGLSPSDAGYYHHLSVLLGKLKDHDEAIAASHQAISLNSEDAGYHHHLSVLLGKLKNYEEAISASHRAVSLNPDDAGYRHHLSTVLGRAGRLEEAVGVSKDAIDLNAERASYHHHLSVLLGKLKNYEEAISASHRAVSLNPDDAGYRHQLSTVLRRAGRLEEAVGVSKDAIDLTAERANY